MGRTVYIVAGDSPELYAYLRDTFTCDRQTQVIMDRRVSQRRRDDAPHAPERRRADRRSRPQVDTELAIRCHAVLTLQDPVAME